jgi:hypothetical protein
MLHSIYDRRDAASVHSQFGRVVQALTDTLPRVADHLTHLGEEASVRDILIHMIEEYARHCGHADLLRECIDGRTGF